MTVSQTTSSADQTRALGAAVAALLEPGDLVVLSGGLGSGKTTFAQGAIAALGVTEPVISPTFALVKTYDARLPVVHVDVYRLDRMQELHDLGFEEMIDGEHVVLVEWGDRVAPALPEQRLTVHFEIAADDDVRTIRFVAHGSCWFRRMDAITELGSEVAEP